MTERFDPVAEWKDREEASYDRRLDAQDAVRAEACRAGNHDFSCSCGCGDPTPRFDGVAWCRWCDFEFLVPAFESQLDWRREIRSQAYSDENGYYEPPEALV